MLTLGPGTVCIKILLSKASKDMLEPLVPMFFPSHTHLSSFSYPSHTPPKHNL
jgi:hypothetical protein